MNEKKTYRAAVLGGGLSGLSAAYLLQEEAAEEGIPLEVTLLEAGDRLGGKIGTVAREGFITEIGPNGFLDNKPFTLDLCRRMGVEDRLLRSNDNARKRFIFSGGVMHRLPEDPVSFMFSNLISFPGRIRIAAEYFVPQKKKEGTEDETLAEFVRRRLGQEALETLIDPMASGIFAGDPENMSLAACFPKIVALEEGYGGLIRGMLALKKEASAAGKTGPASAGPGGVLMSFNEGLEGLIQSLAERLKGQVEISSPAGSITRKDAAGPYEITVSGKDGTRTLEADVVILAVPADDGAELVRELDDGLASTMGSITYAGMAVVHVGFSEEDMPRPLDGFGFLIPHREKRRLLGSLWASSIFAGRAPEGKVLLTTMLGGAKDAATPRLPDEELLEVVREELKHTMGIEAEPLFAREKAVELQSVFSDMSVSMQKDLLSRFGYTGQAAQRYVDVIANSAYINNHFIGFPAVNNALERCYQRECSISFLIRITEIRG